MAVDPDDRRIYWANDPSPSYSSYIGSSDLNGNNVSYINLSADIYAMALHPDYNWLFYGAMSYDGVTTVRALMRSNTDGSDPQQIATSSGNFNSLSLDLIAEKIYWVDNYTNIWRANFDGSAAEALLPGTSGIYDIAVDGAAGLIYWCDGSGVMRSPLDESSAPVEIFTGSVVDIALSYNGSSIYYSTNYGTIVYRMDSNGNNSALIATAYRPHAIIVLPEPASMSVLALGGLAMLRRRRNG